MLRLIQSFNRPLNNLLVGPLIRPLITRPNIGINNRLFSTGLQISPLSKQRGLLIPGLLYVGGVAAMIGVCGWYGDKFVKAELKRKQEADEVARQNRLTFHEWIQLPLTDARYKRASISFPAHGWVKDVLKKDDLNIEMERFPVRAGYSGFITKSVDPILDDAAMDELSAAVDQVVLRKAKRMAVKPGNVIAWFQNLFGVLYEEYSMISMNEYDHSCLDGLLKTLQPCHEWGGFVDKLDNGQANMACFLQTMVSKEAKSSGVSHELQLTEWFTHMMFELDLDHLPEMSGAERVFPWANLTVEHKRGQLLVYSLPDVAVYKQQQETPVGKIPGTGYYETSLKKGHVRRRLLSPNIKNVYAARTPLSRVNWR